jgi:hypothetical protein
MSLIFIIMIFYSYCYEILISGRKRTNTNPFINNFSLKFVILLIIWARKRYWCLSVFFLYSIDSIRIFLNINKFKLVRTFNNKLVPLAITLIIIKIQVFNFVNIWNFDLTLKLKMLINRNCPLMIANCKHIKNFGIL